MVATAKLTNDTVARTNGPRSARSPYGGLAVRPSKNIISRHDLAEMSDEELRRTLAQYQASALKLRQKFKAERAHASYRRKYTEIAVSIRKIEDALRRRLGAEAVDDASVTEE